MSFVRTQQTTMSDQDCLADALKELGYKPHINQTPQKIRGHASEMSKEHCQVVLRKEDTGRGADIGFSQVGEGNFQIVTDTYVNSDMNLPKFEADIRVPYTVYHAKKIARKHGYTFLSAKTAAGKTVVRFSARA